MKNELIRPTHTSIEQQRLVSSRLVVASKWPDVFEAGIGGQRTATDREEPRVPSAYLLVYINAEQKALANSSFNSETLTSTVSVDRSVDVSFDLTADLDDVLHDDWCLLQQQIGTLRLEQLHQSLKTICERIEKDPLADRVLSTAFFTGPNAACGEYSHID